MTSLEVLLCTPFLSGQHFKPEVVSDTFLTRLETNKLRNVAKFFAHLLGTDALQWQVLGYIRLTEEDTTSSSRIFIKILFQVTTRSPLCVKSTCPSLTLYFL
jgi:hypothetical protein